MRHIGITRVERHGTTKTVFGQRDVIKPHVDQAAQIVGVDKTRVCGQRLLDFVKCDFGLALLKITAGEFHPQSCATTLIGFI